MSTFGIAVSAVVLSLILIMVWMVSLSIRKKRLEAEQIARREAYVRALEHQREQEQKDRLFKAESGHVPTILYLAKEAERKNIREALFWYDKAAHKDNITGMYGVVRIANRMREDLVLRDKAAFWSHHIQALEGSIEGKYETGKALVQGLGTEIDVTRGIQFLQEAAEADYLPAILFMGEWSLSKNNLTPSPVQSTYWYLQAARLGSEKGMMHLGLNYLAGVGTQRNFQRGVYWLECASERGFVEAMYHAGEVWIDRGSDGNAIAYIWLFIAAYLGYGQAKKLRDHVGNQIGVDSVVGLQSLAKPLYHKIENKMIKQHSVIRALNKLYKRDIPVLSLEEMLDDSLVLSGQSESELMVSSQESLEQETDSTSKAQASSEMKPNSAAEAKKPLDFSQGFSDKPQNF